MYPWRILLLNGSTLSWTNYLPLQIHFGLLQDLCFVMSEPVGMPSESVQTHGCEKPNKKHSILTQHGPT